MNSEVSLACRSTFQLSILTSAVTISIAQALTLDADYRVRILHSYNSAYVNYLQ